MDVGMAHLDGAFGAHDDRLTRQFALEAGDQGGDPSSAVHHRGRGLSVHALLIGVPPRHHLQGLLAPHHQGGHLHAVHPQVQRTPAPQRLLSGGDRSGLLGNTKLHFVNVKNVLA